MSETATPNEAPRETKKVNIAGFTEGQRRKELERIAAKLGRNGWMLQTYNEAGMSSSNAVFSRPFSQNNQPSGSAKIVAGSFVVLGIIILFLVLSGGKNAPSEGDAATQHKSSDYAVAMDGDLEHFKEMKSADRAAIISMFMADNKIPSDQNRNFYNYVSEWTFQKSGTVALQAALTSAQAEYSETGGKWHRPHYNLDTMPSQFSAWDGSHRALEAYIKKSLNDEDSYKHVETRYRLMLDGDAAPYLLLYTTFAAKNGFGAMIKKTISAKATLDGTLLQVDPF
jgi:hypothetical protein